jgi:hypothetical protein
MSGSPMRSWAVFVVGVMTIGTLVSTTTASADLNAPARSPGKSVSKET